MEPHRAKLDKKSCGILSTGRALPTVFIKGCTEDGDTGKAEKIAYQ